VADTRVAVRPVLDFAHPWGHARTRTDPKAVSRALNAVPPDAVIVTFDGSGWIWTRYLRANVRERITPAVSAGTG
jgi:hypothetical protein